MSQLPLEGVVVVEMTHTVMGPSCGVVLADLGADVIRLELAPDGDRTRRLTGFASGFFAYFNRNKRCINVDLKTQEGIEIAHALIRRADVLVENFGPGTVEKLKLGYEDAKALNPRLIYCALKGFLSGPYEHRPALDEIVQFMTGLSYMTGPPGQPLRAGSSVIDIMGGVMGAVAILAALRQRDADGMGRKVTSSLYESAAFLVGQHMAGEAATGIPCPPMPVRASAWGVYEVFATADAPIFIGVTSDAHWRAFCGVFDRADLAADERFASNALRVANRAALRDIVAGIVAAHPIDFLAEAFDRVGIPFSPVRKPGDLFDDPQMNAHGRMLEVRMPKGNIAKLPPLPVCLDDDTPKLRLQPPMPGEQTDEILVWLGYAPADIAALREAGTVT